MTAAGKMKAEALAIFDGPECSQETRDVIEWFHASMLEDAERMRIWAESYSAKAGLAQQEQAGLTVSLDFLKRVQESLSDYCGELDWGNADMELMDEVEAMLAAAPKGEKP